MGVATKKIKGFRMKSPLGQKLERVIGIEPTTASLEG